MERVTSRPGAEDNLPVNPVADHGGSPATRGFMQPVALAISVLGISVLAGFARFSQIWPQSIGMTWQPYEDEGVYALANQLALQGAIPYRDFFFGHPPLAAYVFSPALLYHFNLWGSPTSFIMARYFSSLLGALCVPLVFAIAWKLGGWKAGLGAAAIWSIDAMVIESNRQVMLESPLALFSLAAVFAALMAADSRKGGYWAAVAGLLAAMAALTKAPGVLTIIVVILTILLARKWIQAVLAGGVFAGVVVTVGLPFQLLSNGEMLKQVLSFQLSRPVDGIVDPLQRLWSTTGGGGSSLTIVLATIGLIVIAFVLRGESRKRWFPVVGWLALGIALLLTSRSYYAHYYMQVAPPLALIGGAGFSILRLPRGQRQYLWAAAGGLMALALVPLAWLQVSAFAAPHADRIYVMVARYLADTPPGSTMLTLDPAFTFLSAREPARGPDGTYLVDSYGQLIYVALSQAPESGQGVTADAGGSTADVWDTMHQPAAQQSLLDRVKMADYFVLDAKSAGRLTKDTLAQIEMVAQAVERHERYTIYRINKDG
ncbi:MAG: phospholipid carrier-dependent glycosyltransferase [Chloroflexi bacterium]|nr:phospholipid carrier-dependent glycosyltransferase [Chloroflexota bacterium]